MTVYFGALLPRRYIGSSYVERVNSGYRGSVKSQRYKNIWNSELTNNPQLFKTRILKTFDSKQTALEFELFLHIKYNVVKSNKYINMANAQPTGFFGMSKKGIVLTDEHKDKIRKSSLGKCRGKYKPMTEAGRKNISNATHGKNNPMYGKPHPSKGNNINQPRATCEICGAESTRSAITRYHKNCDTRLV